MDFLITLSIIIIVSTIMTYIFNKLNQPPLLAFIVTGILIGPLVFNWVSNTTEILLLSELGIAFLLFSVGISTDFKQISKLNLSVFLLPFFNIIFTFLILICFQSFLKMTFTQSLYFSFILSFSSTMLVAKILIENFEMGSLHGKLSIGILLVEDLIAIIAIPILKDLNLFSINLLLNVFGKTAILIFIAFLLNKFFYPKVVKSAFKSSQSFFLLAIGSCFLFIFISYFLNFDIAVGAFIGGLAISVFPYNLEITNKISSIRDLLSMIFFVSLGMQLSFSFKEGVPLLLIALLLFIFIIKPLIHFFILLFSGYGSRISIKTTVILAQVSEFSLILAMQGWILNQITSSQYSAIIIITALTMVLTPYFSKYNDNIYNFLSPVFKNFKLKHFSRKIEYLKHLPKKIKDHIIIVGSDVVGEAVIKVLGRDENIPLVIVDQDPEKIIPLIKNKQNAICGDINNMDIIKSLDLENAKAVILTLPRFDITMRFLKIAKNINPNIIIYTRAKTNEHALKLYEEGSDLVIIPKVLESNYLLERINVLIQEGPDNLSFYKSAYLSYLRKDVEDKLKNNSFKKIKTLKK
ncbi:MAG: cation:proton antiporter [Candidatus ainarchaeum sp.]|nr:cation:proton antiporter [Candidatus ainarchaeum sp.]MDD3975656.1 cation:proton antiporter [Candidatus ainarchaeum sp.]